MPPPRIYITFCNKASPAIQLKCSQAHLTKIETISFSEFFTTLRSTFGKTRIFLKKIHSSKKLIEKLNYEDLKYDKHSSYDKRRRHSRQARTASPGIRKLASDLWSLWKQGFPEKISKSNKYDAIATGELITIPSQISFAFCTGEKVVFYQTGTKVLWDGHMHIESNNCAPLPIQWGALGLSTPLNLAILHVAENYLWDHSINGQIARTSRMQHPGDSQARLPGALAPLLVCLQT